MYQFFPKIQKFYTDFFVSSLGSFFHRKLRLSPNHLSVIGFSLSLLSAFLIFRGRIWQAFIFLAASLVFDGLDGSVARAYGLVSPFGEKLELFFDRIAELALFAALFLADFVNFYLFLVAWLSIVLMSFLAVYTKIDIGFKRIGIFFGSFVGFNVALFLVAVVQWISIIISLFKIKRFYGTYSK